MLSQQQLGYCEGASLAAGRACAVHHVSLFVSLSVVFSEIRRELKSAAKRAAPDERNSDYRHYARYGACEWAICSGRRHAPGEP